MVLVMNRKIILITVIVLFLLVLPSFMLFSPKPVNQSGNETEVLAQDLNTPWAMDFLPNDTIIFTQRGGKVSTLDKNGVKTVGDINVIQNGESGLLGIAVDPQFAENRYVYLYYTSDSGNRVSRFVLKDKLENETVLIDNIPSAQIHNGGRIKFGPDGELYVTTGDASNGTSAQDKNSLAGKILRLNKDGSVPADNPFNNYVYSYGHRDPQGLVWNIQNGTLYESEHGNVRNDEINIITMGSNYGWPIHEGNGTFSGYVSPIRCYTEFTLAPSGIAFYKNNLYVAGLRGNQLRKVSLSDDGKTVVGEQALFTDLGRIRDVVEHNGYLYICTSNRDGRGIPKIDDDKIIRIKVD